MSHQTVPASLPEEDGHPILGDASPVPDLSPTMQMPPQMAEAAAQPDDVAGDRLAIDIPPLQELQRPALMAQEVAHPDENMAGDRLANDVPPMQDRTSNCPDQVDTPPRLEEHREAGYHCEKCGDDLHEPIFSLQRGMCMKCLPDGQEKTVAVVRNHLLNAQPAFPNRTVNLIRAVTIENADCLKAVVECAFDLVIRDVVDDHSHDDVFSMSSRCGQTYADVMFCWRLVVPAFPVPNDKPNTFTRILLNVTQDKFEEMVKRFSASSEPNEVTGQAFCQLIALVSFIGHLYVRKLVAARVMAQIVHDLIGVRERFPHKNLILCVTELMHVIGRTIDANKQGNMLMTQFIARQENLAATRKSDAAGGPLYPQDVLASVGALRGAREDKWPARAGTVVVQYSIISLQEFRKLWHELHAENKLTPEQMKLDDPRENDAVGGFHLKVTNMIGGSLMAVLFNVQELPEAGKPSTIVGKLKDEISSATSVHASRLQVFDENYALLEELLEFGDSSNTSQ